MKLTNTVTNRTKITNNCVLDSFEFKQIKKTKARKKNQTKNQKQKQK